MSYSDAYIIENSKQQSDEQQKQQLGISLQQMKETQIDIDK